jgi:GDP-L-fucose synthase
VLGLQSPARNEVPGRDAHKSLRARRSHVLPALIRKTHEALEQDQKIVVVWGSGTPLREFLFSDDMAAAAIFLMNLPEPQFASLLNGHESPPLINVRSDEELSIRDLALTVFEVLGYQGGLVFDTAKPDGTPRKLLDSSRPFNLGWKSQVSLAQGIRLAWDDYRTRAQQLRGTF